MFYLTLYCLMPKQGQVRTKTRGATQCLQIYAREYSQYVTLDIEGEIIGPMAKLF